MVDIFSKSTLNEDSSLEKKSIDAVNYTTKNSPLFAQVKRVLEEGAKKGIDSKNIFVDYLSTNGLSIAESGILFPIRSGEQVIFDLVVVSADQVKDMTDVHPSNERDPKALTEESLSDIIPSLSDNGNMFPAIGNKSAETGKLELMDGSRRRMSCIISGKPLRVYVARTNISLADARHISAISRKVKQHSYYEMGVIRLDEFNRTEDGVRVYKEKKELAVEIFGDDYTDSDYQTLLSQLKFAEIPHVLISIIPDYNGLSVAMYNDMHKVSKAMSDYAGKGDMTFTKAVGVFKKSLGESLDAVYSNAQYGLKKKQKTIVSLIKASWPEFVSVDNTAKKAFKKVEKLVEYEDPNKVARKVTTDKGVQFEFKRISEDDLNKIQDYIVSLLKDQT